MSTPEIITFVGLAALIIGSQMGRRALSLRRILLPLAGAGFAAYHFLQGIPTVGGDLDFEIALSVAGAVLGVLAAVMMRVERDERTGRIVTQAGVAYAALWVAVFGGRLAFAWAAGHVWSHQVAQFSFQHEITSAAAWTAAFILMALSMVAVRTATIAIRALLVAHPLPMRAIAES